MSDFLTPRLDPFFTQMEDNQWPTTLHSDLGCDQYDKVLPYWRGSDQDKPGKTE